MLKHKTILLSIILAGSALFAFPAFAYTFSTTPDQPTFTGNTGDIYFDFSTTLNEIKSLATCQGNTNDITRATLGFYDQANWFAVDYQVNPEDGFTITNQLLTNDLAVDCSFEPGQDGCINPFSITLTPRDDADTLNCDPIFLENVFNYYYSAPSQTTCSDTATGTLCKIGGAVVNSTTGLATNVITNYFPYTLVISLLSVLLYRFRKPIVGFIKR